MAEMSGRTYCMPVMCGRTYCMPDSVGGPIVWQR